MSAPLVVVGDALLDVDVDGEAARLCPDAPAPVLDAASESARPGGAALTALLAALSTDRPVRLVTAVPAEVCGPGDDGVGGVGRPGADDARLRALLAGSVEIVGVPARGAVAVKTRLRADGRTLLRLDRGGLTPGPAPAEALAAIAEAGAVLVSDYGRGLTADPALRAALTDAARRVPLVWDPHPRGSAPVPGAALVTPNLDEALTFAPPSPPATGDSAAPVRQELHSITEAGAAPAPPSPPATGDSAAPVRQELHSITGAGADDWLASADAAAGTLRERWAADAVVVTAGGRGAVLRGGAGTSVVPAPASTGGDPCGAGDRFAAAAVVALAAGRAGDEAVADAVAAASAFVAGGGASGLARRDDGAWSVPGVPNVSDATSLTSSVSDDASLTSAGITESVEALVARVRARGGRLIATGGCFDLLHAGHARTLAAARGLGGPDGALVVLINADASVRRLKGPGRPIVGEADRADLLGALACVDGVVVFTEDDPQAVLARLCPDVWVKGGDYAADDLPEAPLVRSWGGRVVTVPYHAGRSSTRLVHAMTSEGDSS